MTKINPKQEQGKEAINKLLSLTNNNKKEKHEKIKEEILKEVFEW